jgi:hypothetical protein
VKQLKALKKNTRKMKHHFPEDVYSIKMNKMRDQGKGKEGGADEGRGEVI